MTRTNIIVMMKDFSLVSAGLAAVLAALVVLVALIALVVLAVLTVTAVLIAGVTDAEEVTVAEEVTAVVEDIDAVEVAAEADKIRLVKKDCKPLHFDVEAFLIDIKHKGQISVHMMIVMLMQVNGF